MVDIALELITVNVTAPGGAGAAMAAVAGNSLTVRDSGDAKLISMWGVRQQDGFTRITSPLLHDAVVGIQHEIDAGVTQVNQMPVSQKLTSQDTLTVVGGGSGTAGDIEVSCFLVFYKQLAGICANLITWDELKRRGAELYASSQAITTGTTGGYSGEEAINAEQDQLKANMDYAIIGASIDLFANLAAIRYRSPDWGNLGIGLPALGRDVSHKMTDFFARLSKVTGLPTIPVFNASNKSLVLVDGAGTENAVSPTIVTHMVRLDPPATAKRNAK